MISYDGLYNKNYFGDFLSTNNFSGKKLSFRVFDNALILPHKTPDAAKTGGGGIVDEDGIFVEGSFIHRGIGTPYIPKEKIIRSDETVIYFGMIISVWGHCLTDNLKRAWFLKSKIFRKEFKKCRIVYVPMFGGIVPAFAELLKILEIDAEKLVPIERPIRFKKIILPDESFFLGRSENFSDETLKFVDGTRNKFGGHDKIFFTGEYVETIDRVRNFARKKFSRLSDKKFYFFYGKNQTGEQRLAEYFQSKGYAKIIPQDLPLAEQLNILANCENFASVTGSISHNVIFLPDGANAVLIPRRAAFVNIWQQALNQIHDLNIFYVDSTLSLYPVDYGGPFCYIISRELKNFFGDAFPEKYDDEDFVAFMIYSKFAREHDMPMNPDEKNYLEKVLPEFFSQLKKSPLLSGK